MPSAEDQEYRTVNKVASLEFMLQTVGSLHSVCAGTAIKANCQQY